MKRKKILILLGFLTVIQLGMSSIAQGVMLSPNAFVADFSQSSFAVEIDLQPLTVGQANPDLINDLLDPSAVTGDSEPLQDLQFYLAYMNQSGIETAFSALEKIELKVNLGDVISTFLGDKLKLVPALEALLDKTIVQVNATAPLQQAVQHYETPWNQDIFVTNNFMSLIAYSTNPDDQVLDKDDEMYLGYTFAIQELTEAISAVLVANGHSSLDPFGYKAFFEPLENGYKFGINYTNMLVLWQSLQEEPKGIDFGWASQYMANSTDGVIYGRDIAGATMLDHIGFEYIFTVDKLSYPPGFGPEEFYLGRVETHYNIGETNLLITDEDTLPTAPGGWNHTPFVTAPSYTFDMPSELAGVEIPNYVTGGDALTIPDQVTVQLRNMTFYTDDDAKARIGMANGFGMTVMTATSTFGMALKDKDPTIFDNLDNVTDPTIDMKLDDHKYFYTDFTGKYSYKLKGLEDLYPDIDPNEDQDVIIDYIRRGMWQSILGKLDDIAFRYFKAELKLAYKFTRLMIGQLAPQYTAPSDEVEYFAKMRYFTLTEFPQWYGGEIVHDPTYSAVAAVSAVTPTDNTTTTTGIPATGTGTGTGTGEAPPGIPGFELISAIFAVLVAIPILRKTRRE